MGFVAVMMGALYMSIVINSPWWGVAHILLHALPFALLGGLGLAYCGMAAVNRFHKLRGDLTCERCGAPLRIFGECAACNPSIAAAIRTSEMIAERRRRMLRPRRIKRYWRQFKSSLKVYVAFAPATLAIWLIAPPHGRSSANLGLMAFVSSNIVLAVGLNITCHILELFHKCRRFRLRMSVFLPAFIIPPLLALAAYLVLFG